MLLAGAPFAARQAQRNLARCERHDRQPDGPNAPGRAAREERAATSVRRAGGEATLRALAFPEVDWCATYRVPEVSLRRRRVPHLAALRGRNVRLAMNRICCVVVARMNCD